MQCSIRLCFTFLQVWLVGLAVPRFECVQPISSCKSPNEQPESEAEPHVSPGGWLQRVALILYANYGKSATCMLI